MGELLATAAGVETIVLADVDAAEVAATRDRLRFLPDRRQGWPARATGERIHGGTLPRRPPISVPA